ncbi:MAG: ZIP family metal transporter [Flavobacteriia bacterium]|nr:ZIP family metal transporter [Flavobacteriia bacterium]
MEKFLVYVSLIGAVILGGFIVTYLHAANKNKFIKLMLSFSGGFLLAIAFTHFVPELYDSDTKNIGIYILLGFLIQLLLEFFSGGIEHGHVHVHKEQKMPWGLFISLSVHSLLEGIPLGNQYAGHEIHHDHAGHSLLFGILFHQLPVAVALMTLLLTTNISKVKAWTILIFFAIMTPLGLTFGLFATESSNFLNFNMILAIVVGMFLHISTTIIFETSENHKFNILKLTSILIGFVLAFLIQ